MTFVNGLLLWGGLAIAVPIVLHLIMRQKPKLLEFPALRFIQRRHDMNQRRLRLRHLLLLLLRALAITALAMALARPSIKLSRQFGSQEAPVAAALIFDVGPHMQYVREKKTRLDAAKDFGQWLLEQLPPESQIAVCDSGIVPQSFDVDRGLSKQRIGTLDICVNPRPLTRIVGEAVRVLQKSELQTKEIYIFTDLSRASWPAEDASYLQDRLRELSGVSVYLIDVGVTDPSNFALGDLTLSRQIAAAGSSVDLQTDISCLGADGERIVALEIDGDIGNKNGQQQIMHLKAGETQTVEFHVGKLSPGTFQGRVHILGQDALAADDERFFSVEVRPPWPVLIVAQPPVDSSAIYWESAIAPSLKQKQGHAQYQCDVIDYGELAARPLDKYAAVCLLDPPGLEPGIWQKLTDYAAAGHGVGVFLGRHSQPIEAFNAPAAQQLLPGQLKDQVPREEGDCYLAPQNFQNRILKPFAALATRTPWNLFPVYRYWRIDDLNPGASTIIAYNDGRPALLERPIGSGLIAGRVLMLSTTVSDRLSWRDAWNEIYSSARMKPWPFLALANQMMTELVGSGDQQLNYPAGVNSVLLSIRNPGQRRIYTLTPPTGDGQTLPPPEKTELTISGVDRFGNYQVDSTGTPKEPTRGFSINLPARLTDLSRLSESDVNEMFGPTKPQIARSNEQVTRNIGYARVGREIYSWMIIIFAGLLSMEYVVSNWFYKEP